VEYELIWVDSEQKVFEIPIADAYIVFPFGGIRDR